MLLLEQFCDPHLEKKPKNSSIIETPLRCNSLFSTIPILKPFIHVSIGNSPPVKSVTMKNRWYCVLRHNPFSPKNQKNSIVIDLSQYSNRLFSATIRALPKIDFFPKFFTFVDIQSRILYNYRFIFSLKGLN